MTTSRKADRPERVAAERKRRKARGVGYKLQIPKENLDLDRYVYRYANDVGSRIYDLTENDDYVPVSQDDNAIVDGAQLGATIAKTVTRDDGNGAPVKAVLLKKRRDWWREEQREIAEEEREKFTQMRDGKDPDGSRAPGTYALDGNSL